MKKRLIIGFMFCGFIISIHANTPGIQKISYGEEPDSLKKIIKGVNEGFARVKYTSMGGPSEGVSIRDFGIQYDYFLKESSVRKRFNIGFGTAIHRTTVWQDTQVFRATNVCLGISQLIRFDNIASFNISAYPVFANSMVSMDRDNLEWKRRPLLRNPYASIYLDIDLSVRVYKSVELSLGYKYMPTMLGNVWQQNSYLGYAVSVKL